MEEVAKDQSNNFYKKLKNSASHSAEEFRLVFTLISQKQQQ